MKWIPQVLQRTVVVELGRPLPIEPAEPQEPGLCFRDVSAQPPVVERLRLDELERALRIDDELPIQRNEWLAIGRLCELAYIMDAHPTIRSLFTIKGQVC